MGLPEVGDLAYLATCHCDASRRELGHIGRVVSIKAGVALCVRCREYEYTTVATLDTAWNFRLQDLRRIPPLSELEFLSDKHDIPVPAGIRGLKRVTKELA